MGLPILVGNKTWSCHNDKLDKAQGRKIQLPNVGMSCPKYALRCPCETALTAGKKLLKDPPPVLERNC